MILVSFVTLLFIAVVRLPSTLSKVIVGVDILKNSDYSILKGSTLAALTNPTSLLNDFTHIVDDLAVNQPKEMKLILGPEHGFRGNLQAETGDPDYYVDEYTNLPVISAYSLSTEELTAALKQYQIDTVLIDMQDVGVRLYTYIWTMFKVMNALSAVGNQDHTVGKASISPRLIIADRPNPNGGLLVDGPMLNMSFSSGYGRVPIPFLHGMTIGELAIYFNSFLENPFATENIQIIKMENWKRSMTFYETGLSWIPPSPNLPTIFSALSYPATVFLEATTLSEGRGTCTPFTIFGAPFYSAHSLANSLNALFPDCHASSSSFSSSSDSSGSVSAPVSSPSCFRAAYYQPTFQKYNNTMIEGVQYLEKVQWIHASSSSASSFVLRNFSSAVSLLIKLKELADPKDSFQWDGSWFGHPGTELMDQYAGTDQLRIMIDSGYSTEEIVNYFAPETDKFNQEVRSKYLLY
jgi:uncharacterized protein YbbC (DUF1343 family)